MTKQQTTVTTTMRLPEEKYAYIKEKANEIGISQNAFMSVLIDLGIKLYDGKVSILLQPNLADREKG